jgi:hypothetical protein
MDAPRIPKWLAALMLALGTATCAGDHDEPESTATSASAATCETKWTATWQQGSGANNWWVEYVIGGDTVASAYLEVVGQGNVALQPKWGEWVGPTAKIATGASVIVHATNTRGESTQSAAFRYLVDTAPQTATCLPPQDGGTAVDAGACAAGWNATFSQTSFANTWWVEYVIGGDMVASATLEVVGRGEVALHAQGSKWVGSAPFQIVSGTSVVLHAVNARGDSVASAPFRYLVDMAPVIAPCSPPQPPPPPPDQDAGTCSAWMPTWSQTSYANTWWIEYVIGGGAVSSASLEVVDRGQVALHLQGSKWVSSAPFQIAICPLVLVA